MINNKQNRIKERFGIKNSLTANSFKLKASFGFSFVELIVAVAIMAIITSAVLFRQSKFSSDILITNMTYEIALAIRQAQVYGISSRQNIGCTSISQLGCSDTDKYKVGYGVHFESSITDTNGRPNFFREFIDLPDPGSLGDVGSNTEFTYTYSGGSENVSVDPDTLSQGKIRQYCASNDGSEWYCGPAVGVTLDIVFVKPNPDAHINLTVSGTATEYSQAKIVVESALGDKCRTVTIYGSGQISVDPASADGGCSDLQ